MDAFLSLVAPGIVAVALSYWISLKIGTTIYRHYKNRTPAIYWGVFIFLVLYFYIFRVIFSTLESVFKLQKGVFDFDYIMLYLYAWALGDILAIIGLTLLVRKIKTKFPVDRKPTHRWRTLSLIMATLLAIFILPAIMWLAIINASAYRPIAEWIVTQDLLHSCAWGKSGCDEMIPIPANLQNKKIVVDDSSFVEFEPNEVKYRDLSDLDVLGFIDVVDQKWPGENFVDPAAQMHGYIKEKEFTFIRAVHHYNCSYCSDSGDTDYFVVQDAQDHKYMVFKDGLNQNTNDASLLLVGQGWKLAPVQ